MVTLYDICKPSNDGSWKIAYTAYGNEVPYREVIVPEPAFQQLWQKYSDPMGVFINNVHVRTGINRDKKSPRPIYALQFDRKFTFRPHYNVMINGSRKKNDLFLNRITCSGCSYHRGKPILLFLCAEQYIDDILEYVDVPFKYAERLFIAP